MSYGYKVDWTKVPVDAKILVSGIEDGGLEDILQITVMGRYMRMPMVKHHFLQIM